MQEEAEAKKNANSSVMETVVGPVSSTTKGLLNLEELMEAKRVEWGCTPHEETLPADDSQPNSVTTKATTRASDQVATQVASPAKEDLPTKGLAKNSRGTSEETALECVVVRGLSNGRPAEFVQTSNSPTPTWIAANTTAMAQSNEEEKEEEVAVDPFASRDPPVRPDPPAAYLDTEAPEENASAPGSEPYHLNGNPNGGIIAANCVGANGGVAAPDFVDPNGDLIEANLVDSFRHVPRATVVKPHPFQRCVPDTCAARSFCVGIILVIAAVATTGIICGVGNCTSADSGDATPSETILIFNRTVDTKETKLDVSSQGLFGNITLDLLLLTDLMSLSLS